MRVFLCSYGGFSVAIPMSFVSSLTLLAEDTDVPDTDVPDTAAPDAAAPDAAACGEAACSDAANGPDDPGACVSLPGLFELPSINARHGITLNDGEKKITLLSTEVECETEIPDEEIHPIPKVLSGTRFFALFSGIKFAACPLLVLKPGRLLLKAQAEALPKKTI